MSKEVNSAPRSWRSSTICRLNPVRRGEEEREDRGGGKRERGVCVIRDGGWKTEKSGGRNQTDERGGREGGREGEREGESISDHIWALQGSPS